MQPPCSATDATPTTGAGATEFLTPASVNAAPPDPAQNHNASRYEKMLALAASVKKWRHLLVEEPRCRTAGLGNRCVNLLPPRPGQAFITSEPDRLIRGFAGMERLLMRTGVRGAVPTPWASAYIREVGALVRLSFTATLRGNAVLDIVRYL